MELTEEKRELNNILVRNYISSGNEDENKKAFSDLVNYNLEFISYVINHEFPNIKHYQGIYKKAFTGLIKGIKGYEMDKISSFEAFLIVNIRNEIMNNICDIMNTLLVDDDISQKNDFIYDALNSKKILRKEK